jgi:hypothetical protein
MKLANYLDGEWLQSEYQYDDRKVFIKSRKGHGMKAIIFFPNDNIKVEKVLRYAFILPDELLKRVKKEIDKLNETNLKSN